MISISKLMLVGIGGLGACIGISQLFRQKVSGQIKETKTYKEAVELLKEHRGARYLLGEPITDSLARFNSPGEAFGRETEVKVHVVGPKSKGVLFFTLASEKENDWSLNTVQLQVGNDDNKRLVIKKSIKEESSGS